MQGQPWIFQGHRSMSALYLTSPKAHLPVPSASNLDLDIQKGLEGRCPSACRTDENLARHGQNLFVARESRMS